MWKKVLLWAVIGGAAAFLIMQLIPYGRDHTNPPVVKEAPWNSPRTRELAAGACFDCHSNETVWPWYSNIAPGSWLLYGDVSGGRENLNFSEWQNNAQALGAADAVERKSMPPKTYSVAHKAARLTDAQRAELALGFRMMAGQ